MKKYLRLLGKAALILGGLLFTILVVLVGIVILAYHNGFATNVH